MFFNALPIDKKLAVILQYRTRYEESQEVFLYGIVSTQGVLFSGFVSDCSWVLCQAFIQGTIKQLMQQQQQHLHQLQLPQLAIEVAAAILKLPCHSFVTVLV